MKFFKLLFSKILVVVILFLAQVALIFAAVRLLQIFPLFHLISVLVALAVFLHIVNKKEPPEFKIPWLVLLFLLPFFTIMVYLLFANPKMTKKECARLKSIQAETDKHLSPDPGCAAVLGDNSGIENYLSEIGSLHGHTGNRVTYFKVGEDFWQDLLAELARAEKYIFMEYFIVHSGKMWNAIEEILLRKVKEGVEVRLMYDDIGSMCTTKRGFCKKMRKAGVDCRKFNPFRPVVSGVHNNRDHRKITVIDGKIGYTGGVNLGDEYINADHRLGHWKDTAIKIEGSAVDNLLALYLQLFDMNAKKTAEDYGKYFAEHQTFDCGGYIHPFGDGPKPFYTEQIGENNYINLINAAKRYCYITTPYLIPDYNLTAALRNAAFRGVDVRIVTPHIPDKKIVFNITRSNYPYLMKAGVKIYEYTPGFIHAKMLVADDELAFVGTINIDYRSLVHHYECGAVMCKTPCIADIKSDLDGIFSASQQISPQNFKMGKLARLTNAVLNMFSPML